MQKRPLLIGSRASNLIRHRPDSDYDVVWHEHIDCRNTETHMISDLGNDRLFQYATGETTFLPNGMVVDMISDLGASIVKRSHLHREVGFNKHIMMYHKHLKQFVSSYTEDDRSYLKERTRLTMEKFFYPHPKLNKPNVEFFDDLVQKKYDHDYLHELFAFYDKPLYTRLQHDSTKAWCDKGLWESLSYDGKNKCVAEEVYVIATERFLVPKDWQYPCKLAFHAAMVKVCTTLCSGWFRDHAIDNFPTILDLVDQEKFTNVRKTLQNDT